MRKGKPRKKTLTICLGDQVKVVVQGEEESWGEIWACAMVIANILAPLADMEPPFPLWVLRKGERNVT